MPPPKKPHRRNFFMQPAVTPEQPPEVTSEETKQTTSVYRLLRDHVAYAAATRAEVRALRQELHKFSEDVMKISELSSSVDRLISVARSLKDRADTPATQSEQPDDPAIEELHHKIQRAIEVLEGRDGGEQGFQPAPPSAEAQATDINSRDPNAPV